jgi:hypothetical protein
MIKAITSKTGIMPLIKEAASKPAELLSGERELPQCKHLTFPAGFT